MFRYQDIRRPSNQPVVIGSWLILLNKYERKKFLLEKKSIEIHRFDLFSNEPNVQLGANISGSQPDLCDAE